MSEKKLTNKENPETTKPAPDSLSKSTEQTVCAPEFPDGCIDVEDAEV